MTSRLAAFLFLCALVGGIVAVSADDLWYQSYKDGVAAFKKNDYATAEKKFLASLNTKLTPTSRGRSVLYYSQIRDEFIPEYYLAIVSAKLGKFADAMKYAASAERYLKSSDKEYPQLVAAKADAQKGLTPTQAVVAESKPVNPPQPVARPPSNTATPPPAVDPAVQRRTEFERLIADANANLRAQRFANARDSATKAKDLGVDDRQADEVLRRISVDEIVVQLNAQLGARAWAAAAPLVDRLATLDPNNAAVRPARDTIARGQARDEAGRLERDGLSAFYRGNYQQAIAVLSRVPADLSTPRVLLYMACSNAALALLEGDDKGQARLTRARELFRQARPQQNTFAVDRKYISPQIIRALGGSTS